MSRWAVLLTTHDRVQATVRCLEALESQTDHDVDVDVFVCDAGSSDGTPAVVQRRFPAATVLRRGGDLYWNAGMRVAWAHARSTGRYDAYLWLNDDTFLDPDALARFAAATSRARTLGAWPAVLVGAVRDPDTGTVSYSGVVRHRRHLRPLRWSRVVPGEELRAVETMNGNCVLVPSPIAEHVGNLDRRWTHGLGDYDYGLRVRRKGYGVLLLPGTVGTCRANPAAPDRSLREEWRHLRGTKGLPVAEWTAFASRWAGPLWPLFAASPYVRRLARRLVPRRGRRDHVSESRASAST